MSEHTHPEGIAFDTDCPACQESKTPYPEHDKLHAVKDESQAIGEFLDFGLGRQNMAIYERVTYDCECEHCGRGQGDNSRWHSEEEIATLKDGKVQISTWQHTHKSIEKILATYFEIDQKKIDDEKRAMLEAIRAQ